MCVEGTAVVQQRLVTRLIIEHIKGFAADLAAVHEMGRT